LQLLLVIFNSGELSWFSLLYVFGSFLGMTFNIHQEKIMVAVPMKQLNFPQQFKFAINFLRQQNMWLFLFSWIAVVFSLIPGFDQTGVLNYGTFFDSWVSFLPFTNLYMNLFNIGHLIQYFTGLFLNKFESSFNTMTSNISAVLVLGTGWVPFLMAETVGFVPCYSLTIPAMVLSLLAIIPTYYFGIEFSEITSEVMAQRRIHEKQLQNELSHVQ